MTGGGLGVTQECVEGEASRSACLPAMTLGNLQMRACKPCYHASRPVGVASPYAHAFIIRLTPGSPCTHAPMHPC